jgi:NAD(P)-dependent dehydrogenase (short-subunit alcohol dehydrogenase family)
MKLQNAVAVVTGASRGIGKALALALAQEGAQVVCTSRSTEAVPSRVPGTIDETARQVEALGRRVLAIPCNVAEDEQVENLARRTLDEFDRIDILVNNAAYLYAGPFEDTPKSRWDRVMDVNLRGAVLCTRAFLPQMIQQQSGRLLNVSSGATVDVEGALGGPYPDSLSYVVSKAALDTFTVGLGLEVRRHGIAVNGLRVDMAIVTEGAIFLNPAGDYSGWERPETAAEAALWIITREPSYTGHMVTVTEAQQALARGA